MLDLPRPAMPYLEPGLARERHLAKAKQHSAAGIEGLTVSTIGRAFGPTWPATATHTLDFLEWYPRLQHLHVHLPGLTTLEPLRFVEETLESLLITGFDKNAKFSLAPISRCRRLRTLTLTRTPKDLDIVWELPQLEHLSLTGFNDAQLQPSGKLPLLKTLYLGFGGMKQIELLDHMPNLAAIELQRTRGLADLTPLAALTQLQFIQTSDLAQVTTWPRCKRLTKLRRVFLDTMNGLTDLQGLAEAPHLEELIVINSKIPAAAFTPFAKHPSLARAEIGLGTVKATHEVEDWLGSKSCAFFGTPLEKFSLAP